MWKPVGVPLAAIALLATPAMAQEAQEPERMTLYEAVGTEDADVFKKTLRAKAAEEWPDDFQMQKFVIEQQMEALQWLGSHAKAPNGVPQATYDRIYAKAAADWPDDFTMIRYVIEQQVEAYRELQ